MKKILAMLLAVAMILSLAACGGKKDADVASETDANVKTYTYTYNTYSSALGTNWNPHTWEMNADDTILSYVMAPLADLTVLDSDAGSYQWIFVAAKDIKDVTAEHQDDLVKYNCVLPEGVSLSDIKDSYVYEISLREEMCWEDGTPINADTYVYSMEQMLSPDMKNYRANNYYSGESALAGAAAYFYGGSVAWNTDACGAYAIADLVKGEDGTYTTADGVPVAFALTSALEWLSGYSLFDYVDAYGSAYFGVEDYEALEEMAVSGFVPVTDESIAHMIGVITAVADWGESEADICNYIYTGTPMERIEYDGNVGLYKVDEYTIRYVCESAYEYNYFLTSCTSNWIVNEEMYEKCKDTSGTLVTSTYNTSADTTVSCGAYRIDSLQDDKQIVFVQNEKYWEYEQNEDGTLSSTTFFKVDGEYQPQYLTEKIVIDVMSDDAAKLAFLSGALDDWTPAADEVVEYTTSDQLYKVDETYTMRLFFHSNLDSLKKMDEAGNTNSVVLSNDKFREAMSLAINRAEFVTATAGYKAAYSMLSSLYFYDVYEDPESIYRNTDEAKQAICNLYGVAYGDGEIYATLDDAYKSINGYNLTEAKAIFTEACKELVEAGLYTEGENIVIEMAWMAGAMDSSNQQQVTLLNKYMNEALEGTGFGSIELKAIDNLSNRYEDVYNGVYAIGYGAWGGAAFYPFTMFRVYCDDDYVSYIHEGGCWNPATETLTLTVNGEEVTMTWKEWSKSMSGTGVYSNADNATKLAVLSQLEENFLKLYYCIPLCTTTACSMLSYKTSYYTENYSIMYSFGGLRLMTYNYTNAEWADYVASQNGSIAY